MTLKFIRILQGLTHEIFKVIIVNYFHYFFPSLIPVQWIGYWSIIIGDFLFYLSTVNVGRNVKVNLGMKMKNCDIV